MRLVQARRADDAATGEIAAPDPEAPVVAEAGEGEARAIHGNGPVPGADVDETAPA